MSTETDISVLYHEFTDALTEFLAENAVGLARRGRWVESTLGHGSTFSFKLPIIVERPVAPPA